MSKKAVELSIRMGKLKEGPLEDNHDLMIVHAQRVAFFVNNPCLPIDISYHLTPLMEPYLWVDDGNHRLAAAIYRGDTTIMARCKNVC